jgi:hypothetical protein
LHTNHIMAPSSFPVTIRDAKPLEFRALGELWAKALADDDLFKILWSKADPDAMLKWVWEGSVAGAVARGADTVRVLERTDNSEVIGVIWFYTPSAKRDSTAMDLIGRSQRGSTTRSCRR